MFSYDELLDKYNALLVENKNLKSQVNELRIKLGMPIEIEEKTILETSGTEINKYSSSNEKILSPLTMNNISITIVTRPPDDFKDKNKQIVIDCTEQLKQYGIKVIYKSDFHQKFAIIDQSVVWYGSVNFLSFGTHEESIMRFENSDVAHQLMDTIL